MHRKSLIIQIKTTLQGGKRNETTTPNTSSQSAACAERSFMEKTPSNIFTLSRRIGSTNYRVNAHFSEKAAETFEDKIFHLIQNEGLESETKCAILNVPLMSRQSERSQL